MHPQATHQDPDTRDDENANSNSGLSLPNPMPLEAQVTVGEKGRIVIPAAIREAMGFKTGDVLDVHIENHELHMSTRWNRMARAQERARKFFGPNRSLADELIAERRAEALREEQE